MTETTTKRPRRSRKPVEYPDVDGTITPEPAPGEPPHQELSDEGFGDYPVKEQVKPDLPAVRTEMPTSAAGTYALATMTDEAFSQQLAMMKTGRDRIGQIQREIMVVDVDYGLIPGTPKPTLFKPGAEKLALMYGLAAELKHEFIPGDGDTAPAIQYHATAFLHLGNFNGPIVAVGHGTANSWEKRYRRDAQKQCPNCGKMAIIKSKPQFGGGWYCFPKKEGCGASFKIDDERLTEQATDAKGDSVGSWDLGNTLLKMAEKRAFVDVVLRATASSSLFTQDVAEEPVVDNRDEPSGGARRTVDTSGDYMDVSSTPADREMRGSTTGDPDRPHLEHDEPDTEVRSAELGEVQRGGHRAEVTETQITEARRLATSMKLNPWQVAIEIAEALPGSEVEMSIGPIHAIEADDRGKAGKWLLEFMQSMSPDDMGKVITHLRAKSAAQ